MKEIDYIYTEPPYNHTWFSDLLPNDMKQFLGEIHNEVSVDAAADSVSCSSISDLPPSTTTRINSNTYCPSVGYQQYGDCWSWSSTTQADCNYNQKAYNWYNTTATTTTTSRFSKLYTDFCSGAGDIDNGGSAYSANKYFTQNGDGACSYYKYPYPGPGGNEDEDQECEHHHTKSISADPPLGESDDSDDSNVSHESNEDGELSNDDIDDDN